MVAIVVPPEFGYVIGIFMLSVILNFYLMRNVGVARKKFDCQAPAMYSDKSPEFNCIQRAHQNYLETWYMFLFMLFLVGVFYPLYATGCGVVFLVGRFVGLSGYATGDPEKRKRGIFAFLGLLGLFGALFKIAGHDVWKH